MQGEQKARYTKPDCREGSYTPLAILSRNGGGGFRPDCLYTTEKESKHLALQLPIGRRERTGRHLHTRRIWIRILSVMTGGSLPARPPGKGNDSHLPRCPFRVRPIKAGEDVSLSDR